MRTRRSKAQVGLRISAVLFPVVMVVAGAALGACSSTDGNAPSDPSNEPDAPDLDTGSDTDRDPDAAQTDATDLPDAVDPLDASRDANDGSADAEPDRRPPVDTGPPLDCSRVGPSGQALHLGCTGLYASWPDRTIAPDARAFTPAFTMWSDGAKKSRYIYLPPGTKIDTTNMDEWLFPVGTKVWKEFRLGNRRVETRLLWKKTNSDWYRTTYVWSQDQSTAVENTRGVVDIWGTGYDVSSQADCVICHNGHLDQVIGFEAIGLSNAGASGLTMAALVNEQRVTQAPSSSFTVPGNATERAALGTLHANCGNGCHSNSNYALAKDTGLFMRLRTNNLASVAATDTVRTSVNVVSRFQGPGGGYYRIRPNDVAHSAIPYRDGFRDTSGERVQMPPLGTHKVDTAGLQLVKDWINSM